MSYGELRWLKDAEVKSNAIAKADIARGIGGKTRYLFELATGGVPAAEASTSQPCTPRNPQGQIGVDHSGPPWGVAFKHPVLTGRVIDPSNQVDICSPQTHITIANGGSYNLMGATVMRSRPYAPQTGRLAPYQRIPLWVQTKGATGTMVAVVNYRRGSNLTGATSGCVVSITSSAEQFWEFTESYGPGGLHLPPSGQDEFFINLSWTGTGSITLTGYGCWQTAHLFHV